MEPFRVTASRGHGDLITVRVFPLAFESGYEGGAARLSRDEAFQLRDAIHLALTDESGGSPPDRTAGAAPAASFPLDAEQILRLFVTGLARTLNAVRPRDMRPIDEGQLLLTLADEVGIQVPTGSSETGERWPLPRGEQSYVGEFKPPDRRPRSRSQGYGTPAPTTQASPNRGEADA